MLQKQKLIAAIYASTLSQPDVFDYITKLDDILFGVSSRGADAKGDSHSAAKVDVDAHLIEHIKLTAQIQSEMGRKSSSQGSAFQAVIDAVPNPCFVFSKSGDQIAANRLGNETGSLVGKPINQFLNDEFLRKAVKKYLSDAEDHEMLALPARDDQLANPTTLLIKKIVGTPSSSSDHGQYLVSIVDFGFDQQTSETFRSTYNLTEAELQVAVLLAEGIKANDIARQRAVSDQTVRSQIKSIKEKTSVPDIPALVRLLCGFSAGILVPNMLLNEPLVSNNHLVGDLSHITLNDGRKLYYVEQGAEDGFPVLHMHNAAYGSELPKAAVETAREAGLRLIAPYRAGAGKSDKFDSRDSEHYLDQCADDQLELLELLGVDKVIVAGMGVGTAHALRFALRHPEHVTNLVGVGKPPALKDEWLAFMPRAQRFTVRVAKYLPQLLPIIGSVYGSFFDRDMEGNFMRHGLKESPIDLKSLEDPEIFDLTMKSIKYNIKQDTGAFVKDVLIAGMDFTADAIMCVHKFHMLHGALDGVVPIMQSKEFVADVPGSSLEVIADAGSHIYYTHWQAYLDVLNRLARENETLAKLA